MYTWHLRSGWFCKVSSFLARKMTVTALAFSPGEREEWTGSILNMFRKSTEVLTDVSGRKL